MLSDLLKYNQLPSDLRAKIAAPDTVAGIKALEKMYNVSLAGVIMKVMIKTVAINDLPGFLVQELNLEPTQAQALAKDLCDKVLISVYEYLGLPKPRLVAPLPLSPTPNQTPLNNVLPTNQPLPSTPVTPPIDQDKILNEKLATLLAAVNIAWPSSALDSRFRQAMLIYLRGVRNKADTRQTLMKPVEVGGLGLGEKIADKIMNVSATVVNQPVVANAPINAVPLSSAPPKTQPVSNSMPVATPSAVKETQNLASLPNSQNQNQIGIRDAAYDLNDLAKLKPKEIPVAVKETPRHDVGTSLPNQVSPMADEALAKLMAADRARAMAAQPGAPLSANKPAEPEAHPVIDNLNRTPSGKIRMDDITPAPTVLSPVGELRYLNLQKFRYLAKDPTEAAKKVAQKFASLEREGYDKRLAGIKAWRQSPINQLYLRVCRQAMDSGKSAEDVIIEQVALDNQFLTIDEFNALLKLNSLYKF